MSAFRDLVAADIHDVFLEPDEFAELRSVRYDGVVYADIPVVLNGFKEEKRTTHVSDHSQGLYRVTDIAHIALSDLGGNLQERGGKIEITTAEGGTYYRRYYVGAVQNTVGLLRIELEAVDE